MRSVLLSGCACVQMLLLHLKRNICQVNIIKVHSHTNIHRHTLTHMCQAHAKLEEFVKIAT